MCYTANTANGYRPCPHGKQLGLDPFRTKTAKNSFAFQPDIFLLPEIVALTIGANMGRQRSTSVEDVKSILAMPRKNLIPFLKGHHLLRTCSKDKPETLPKVGELVWARVLGSVFWPGFILELKDIETDGKEAEEIDDTAYGFVMFLESTYRYAPVAWNQIIPVTDMETQLQLVPRFNKLVVKTSWKPTSLYKKSLDLATQFHKMPVEKRLESAVDGFQVVKKTRTSTKPTATPAIAPTPTKTDEPLDKAISKVMSTAREKKKSGIRVSERITEKQIVKLKPTPEPKKAAAAAKTENDDEKSAATKLNKNKVDNNPRPEVGGEILKQWTRERFNDFSKQFTFESSNVQCGECNKEIMPEEPFKTCHGFPFHNSCLIQLGLDPPVLKCKMCIDQQCFICKTSSDGDKDQQTYKCSKCDLRFHIECLLKDWPQAEIQGSNGPITCPLHFCHSCLGEQKIYGKFRDYTTSMSKAYKCKLCLSTYHKACLPAGCGESIQGKEYIICPKHTLPQLKVQQRRIGCLDCYKPLKMKEEKVECSYCIQVFHPECVGYTGEVREDVSLEVFGKGYKCFSCRWGLFPMYGQIVWFQQPQHQYWPARILFPAEYKGRRYNAKRQPGQYSVEYFGSTSYYDNASRALPLHLTTVEIFKTMKVYQEVPKILRAHEEAAFCFMFSEEYRDKLLPQPKPVYKKIEKNVYRTVPIQKVREPSEICSCSEEKSELVCQADSGCTNRDMEMECSDRICKSGKRCSNRMFSERKNDEEFLEQKLFLNKGWGVIAKKQFKPGDFVSEYRGEAIDRNEMKWRLSRKDEEDPMYILEISKEFFIDAEYVGNLSRLINHSCDPNCEVRKYLSTGKSVGGIFARRSIGVGEEVTFRYGCGSQSTAPFRCRCGARNCTVFVGKDVPDDYRVEEDPEQNQDKWDDVCSKCGFGGRVICCEFPACGKVWHYQCVGLSRQPRKNWCCPEHPARKVAQLKKGKKASKSKKSKSLSGKANNSSATTPSSMKSVAPTKKKPRQSAPAAASAQQAIVNKDDLADPVDTPANTATNESNTCETTPQPQKRKLSVTTSTTEASTPSQPDKKRLRMGSLPMNLEVSIPQQTQTDIDPQPTKRKQRSTSSTVKADQFSCQQMEGTPAKRQQRITSTTASPVDTPSSPQAQVVVAPQPTKRNQRVSSSVTKPEDSSSQKHSQEQQLYQSGRSLRSSKTLSPLKSASSVEVSSTPSEKTEDLLKEKAPEITPMSIPVKKPVISSRHRRANSNPAACVTFDGINVPSIRNTRSRRNRRGDSMNERTPEPTQCAETDINKKEASLKPHTLEFQEVSNSQDLVMPRMSRRRSRNYKTTEPFSPLALNPCVLHREPPPVHLSNTLTSSDKHVRMGTRSTSGAFNESPAFTQITGQGQTPNGLFTNSLDAPVVTISEIKQEPYDDGYEEDSYRLAASLEETKNKGSRHFGTSDNESSLGSHPASEIDYAATDNDSDLEIIEHFTTVVRFPSILRGGISSLNMKS